MTYTYIDELTSEIKVKLDKLAKVLNDETPKKPYYQTIDMSDWDERWAKTECFIEASDGERDHLYYQYAKTDWMRSYAFNKSSNCLEWRQLSGCGETIGWLKRLNGEKLPVLITCMWAEINGHLIGFYTCNSMVCDHQLLRDFLDYHFPDTPKTNADNLFNGLSKLGIKCEFV